MDAALRGVLVSDRELTLALLDAAGRRVNDRSGQGTRTIAETLDVFLSELGLERREWLEYLSDRSVAQGSVQLRELAAVADPDELLTHLSAQIGISFTDGFVFGVEFVRAQREHMAATS